jgi:O-antigen ligase
MSIAVGLTVATTIPLWLGIGAPPRRPGRTPVLIPAVFWLVALALSAAFALDSAGSFRPLRKALFPALVPLAAFHTSSLIAGRRATTAWLGSAALAATVGLAGYLLAGHGYPARARGAVGHYMTYGGQLMLAALVGLGALVLERGWLRVAGAAALLAGIPALAATYTRSAWIGFGAGLLVVLGVARPRWIPAVLAAGVVVALAAPASMRERAASAFDPRHPTNVERTHMWEAGIRMFRDRPWTGVGLMDLKPTYERYRSPAANEPAGHLHSVPIQIAATMGAVGLVAFILLYGSLLRCATAGLLTQVRARAPGAGVRLGVLSALTAFLVAGLFEWNFGDEELLYPLFVLSGIAWAARDWDRS